MRNRERRKRKNAVLLILRNMPHTRNCPTGVWMQITGKKKLRKLQNEELNGKGADTSVINSYKSKIDTIKSELDYISQKQSFVWNYEKDKRELFDHEPELRDKKEEQ